MIQEDNSNIFNIDSHMQLNTSSLTATDLTPEEFQFGVESKVQDILNKEFADCREKRYIKRTPSGLQFACPLCHDSATDPRKKRGNIALKGKNAGLFTCFNGCGSMRIQRFFQKFDKQLNLSDINYISNNFSSVDSSNSAEINNLTSNVVNKDEAYKWAVDRNYIRDVLSLKDIGRESTPVAWNYLINRCQYTNHERYLYSEKYNQLLILNLVNDRVLGIQLRNIDPSHKGPKYLTMNIEKMRLSMLGDNTPVPESVSKLSCVFNIFNVDFSHTYTKPVLVTEGPFDAFLLPNCIALSGASKNFNMQFPFWYVFDNDPTGRTHAIEKIKQGYKVFLWKKFNEEYGIPEINPYISSGNKRKWDITDIKKYLRDTRSVKKLWWSPYFSNSTLDALDI